MGDRPAGGLLGNVVRVAFSAALARLPCRPRLPHRMLARRLTFPAPGRKSTEMARNLQLVLGDELSPAAVQEVTREWFRLASCEAVDMERLRFRTRPLRRLVEIRGREHLEAALAAGRDHPGTGHFGSHSSAFSVLHASGFPVTTVGRWHHKYDARPLIRRAAVLAPSTSSRCGATGSGRTSSHGLAGPRSRCWQRPRSAPTRW